MIAVSERRVDDLLGFAGGEDQGDTAIAVGRCIRVPAGILILLDF